MNSESFYLNMLYDRGNPLNNLNQYLKTNDGNGYLKSIKLSFNKPYFKKLIKDYPFYPNNFKGTICSFLDLEKLSLNKIALFFSVLINLEKERINDFISLKKEFEYNVLVKNYDNACNIIVQVYKKFGLSLWLVDCVSIIYTLNHDVISSVKELEEIKENDFFLLLSLKNSVNIKHNYYLKQMEILFKGSNIKRSFYNYLRYILFVSVPKEEKEWKDILISSTNYSLIDMYLCLIDYLQGVYCNKYQINSTLVLCQDYLKCINDSKINIAFNFNNNSIKNDLYDKTVLELIDCFESSKYPKVINYFFSNDFKSYDSICIYVLTAISYLFSNDVPENKSTVVYNIILELIYVILKRDEKDAVNAIFRLATIARILKNFDIHKGICVFLALVANYDLGYSIQEMFSTFADIQVHKYEEKAKNYYLVPYISKRIKLDEKIINDYIKLYDDGKLLNYTDKAKYYCKEGYISLVFDKLIQEDSIEEATTLLVNSYMENKLLVYIIDVSLIIKNIEKKYKHKIPLTLEELCYVFIDLNMENLRDDCFLDLFDQFNGEFPIEIVKQINADDRVKDYFLYEICNTNRLSTIYLLFLSGEEAEDYRIEILNYLLKNDYYDKKIVMDEIEDVTKRRTLSRKIRKIDESKLIINADLLRKACNDDIAEKVELFNNTTPFTLKIEVDSSGMNRFKLVNNRSIILESLYNIYCKEFCFGNAGLDISLSTRVRHGTLTNQLLKVFSDNELIFDGHGKNDFFDYFFKSNRLDKKAAIVFVDFNLKINKILDYFVKNTLKVYIDTPIEGAIFDYRYNRNDYNKIFGDIILSNRISSDEIIMLINHYIIEQTNEYLFKIRNEKIQFLEDDLLKELDDLSDNIKEYYIDKKIEKDLERKIITCKTEIQNELKRITNWFVLSDYNEWEAFTFEELIQTCIEIDKNLFSGFEKVKIKIEQNIKTQIKGMYFREFVDIVLIIFNNAIVHSGYKDNLSILTVKCHFTEDSNNYYFSFSNNLNDSIDVNNLDTIIKRINNDYDNKKFLQLNIRQEGGMGLYKIMHIISSVIQQDNSFYINRDDHIFRIELQFSKEISG